MAQVPSVAVLAARADGLRQKADALRAAFLRPAMQARILEAATNLQEAQKWFGDARLEDSDDCRVWVEAILSIAARRLLPFEEALKTHGPDATDLG